MGKFAGITLLLCVATAFADSTPKNNTNHWYVEGNVGYTAPNPVVQDFAEAPPTPPSRRKTITPIGLGFNTGYQFNSFIAAELGFNYFFTSLRQEQPATPPATGKTTSTLTDMYALSLAGKATLPLNSLLSVYGKLGVAYSGATGITRTTTDTGSSQNTISLGAISPVVGAGLQFNLRDDLYAQFGWMMLFDRQNFCATSDCNTLNRPMMNMVTAGIGYRFNQLKKIVQTEATDIQSRLKNWYLEGNMGYVMLSPIHQKTLTPVGLGMNVGYQFNPFIAAELGFNYFLASQRNTFFEDPLYTTNTMTDMHALTLAGKATLPINSIMSLYGKLGLAYAGVTRITQQVNPSVGHSQSSTAVNDITPMFGAGLQINLRDNLYAQLGWMILPGKAGSCVSSNCATVTRPTINTFTAGLGYRFDEIKATINSGFGSALDSLKKWYVEGNVGYTILSPISKDYVQIPSVFDSSRKTVTPVSAGFNTGYQFNSFIAAELGFNYFFASQRDSQLISVLPPPITSVSSITDLYALTFAGKAMLPLGPLLSLYGKLGVAYNGMTLLTQQRSTAGNSQTSYSVGDISPLFGAGLQINLRDNLYAQFGWMMIPGNQGACASPVCVALSRPMVQTVTAGLGYRFDETKTKLHNGFSSMWDAMKKWYLEGNVGYVILSPRKQDHISSSATPVQRTTLTPVGLGINTGYQFNRFIAAELGFNYFFISQRNILNTNTMPTFTLTDMYALTFAGKATLPLSSLLSLYGKLGLAYAGVTGITRTSNSQASVSVGDITPLFGAGVQINLRDNLYTQLGWMMIPGKQSACASSNCAALTRPMINSITAGLGYRFDDFDKGFSTLFGRMKKWYMEGNVGYVLLNPTSSDYNDAGSHRKTVTPLGLGFNAGYQFNPFIAAELGFNYFFASQRHQLSTVTINPPDPPATTNNIRTLSDMYALTFAAKATLPLSSILSLYTKLGIAFAGATQIEEVNTFSGVVGFNSRTSKFVGDVTPLFGGGVQINLRNDLYAQLGWMMIPGKQGACAASGSSSKCAALSRPMINTVTAGLGYRFEDVEDKLFSTFGALKRWYVEGNVGYTMLNPVSQDYSDSPPVAESHRKTITPVGVGFNVGYQFNPFIAAELGFNYFFASQRDTVSANIPPDPPDPGAIGATTNTLTDMYALTLAGKATLPLNSLISLYSKIGLAYTRMSKIVRAEGVLDPGGPFHQQTSHSVGGITPMIGAGVQINLRDNLYAQLGWMMIPGKESPCSATNCDVLNRPMINTVTAGLGYRFDEVSAAEKTQRGSEKWYIEANAGYTLLSPIQPETDGLVPAPPCFISDTKTVTPFGIGTNTGYQFNRFIAAELGFNYFFVSRRTTSLTTIFIEDPPDPPVDFSARQQDQLTDIYALTLAGKATLPLNGLINLYSKLGLAYAGATFKHTQQLTVNGGESTQNSQETTSVNGISPVFGAGFELNLQHNFYVQFGWMMIPAKESSCSSGRCNSVKRPMINEVTGGLGYRFG